ncbi:hypothetical protein AVL60_09055 [Kocuria palustris]|nr:hypothetical protein AVL60_09055 [Kocuria palustris]
MLILFLTRAGSGAVVVRRCSKTHATSPTTEPPLQRTGGSYSGPMSGDEIWTIGHWVCEQGSSWRHWTAQASARSQM